MIPGQLQPLANHLWQSTLFAAVAALLTLALRKHRAQTRYWLWLAASVKFLIPFSLLVYVGSHLGGRAAPAIAPPVLSYIVEQASQPFSVPAPLAATVAAPPSSLTWVLAIVSTVWAIGFTTLLCSWWRRWRGLQKALRTASPLDLPDGIKALVSPEFVEPGVFGIRRPVLLLPAGITDHLSPLQLKAIVAHELCHVRRRDNLATAIHMGVEALFWFHPLVWWLGARLLQEREQACDEEVLLLGSEPQAYAEGILTICELYLKSRLPCVSGVTGANLRKRIEEIMLGHIGLELGFAKRVALMAAGALVLATPVVVGLNTPATRAQSQPTPPAQPTLDVVSTNPNHSDSLTAPVIQAQSQSTPPAQPTLDVGSKPNHSGSLNRPVLQAQSQSTPPAQPTLDVDSKPKHSGSLNAPVIQAQSQSTPPAQPTLDVDSKPNHSGSLNRPVLQAQSQSTPPAQPTLDVDSKPNHSGSLNAPVIQAQSQSTPPAQLTFDAVSIKPNHSGDHSWEQPPIKDKVGRYTARNATLKNVIVRAYGLYPAQISGGPAWLDTARYDIQAQVEGQPGREQVVQMLRALLADRFRLKVHFESRQISRYVLVAPQDGLKFGPHLAKAEGRDCPAALRDTPGCRPFVGPPENLALENINFATLAGTLSAMLGGAIVVDETGLDERYDFKLNVDLSTVYLFYGDRVMDALREQTGLRIESRKGPGQVLLIDSVEEPTGN